MKAIRFRQHGEPADVLTVEEAPVPEPGEGQVRAKRKVVSASHGVFFRLGCRPSMERRRCGSFQILRMVAAIFV
jgi:hypothetical protein